MFPQFYSFSINNRIIKFNLIGQKRTSSKAQHPNSERVSTMKEEENSGNSPKGQAHSETSRTTLPSAASI
jgi:hypothetical protein